MSFRSALSNLCAYKHQAKVNANIRLRKGCCIFEGCRLLRKWEQKKSDRKWKFISSHQCFCFMRFSELVHNFCSWHFSNDSKMLLHLWCSNSNLLLSHRKPGLNESVENIWQKNKYGFLELFIDAFSKLASFIFVV